jgi:hypothetical protein
VVMDQGIIHIVANDLKGSEVQGSIAIDSSGRSHMGLFVSQLYCLWLVVFHECL